MADAIEGAIGEAITGVITELITGSLESGSDTPE